MKNFTRNSAFVYTMIAAIVTIWMSLVFRGDAFSLIMQYDNVAKGWELLRMESCATNRNNTLFLHDEYLKNPYCPEDDRDYCYCREAEEHAFILDFHLFGNDSLEFYQGRTNKYNFLTFGSAETVIKQKIEKLKSYPESWITITTLGISLGAYQLSSTVLLFIVPTYFPRFENTIEKCWIGVFLTWILFSWTLFICGQALKINTPCPSLTYSHKSDRKCYKVETYGHSLAIFLGADAIFSVIATFAFVFDYYFRE